MAKELPENITKPSAIGPPKTVPEETEQKAPSQSFESYMDKAKGGVAKPEQTVSPFDLAKGAIPVGTGPSMDSVLAQMNSTSGVLGDIQKQLHTKDLKLKQSQKYLLRNKLSDANNNLRAAAKKAGVDVGPAPSMATKQSPIVKFLSLVIDSQNQMQNASNLLKQIRTKGDTLNPGNLLFVQLKIAKAQQELEYSSILLSSTVTGIKTIFNIQI